MGEERTVTVNGYYRRKTDGARFRCYYADGSRLQVGVNRIDPTRPNGLEVVNLRWFDFLERFEEIGGDDHA